MMFRRSLLRGAAGSLLALPLLELGSRRVAQAAPGTAADGYPLRMLVFFNPNGCWPATWFPSGSENAFTLGSSMAALEPYKDKLLVLDGVDMPVVDAGPGEDHQQGMGGVLTGRALQAGEMVGGDGSKAGWGDGISIDQRIAEQIGTSTPLRSIEAGIRANAFIGGEVRSRIIYAGPAQPLPPEDNPQALWQRLFADFAADPTEMAIRRAKRVSVLDTVGAQFDRMRTRVGAVDRDKLDQHVALVRDLELRLQQEPVLGEHCMVPGQPPALAPDDANVMHMVSQAQIDLLAMALACDITRVGSLQYSNGANHHTFPFIGSNSDGHGLSHAPEEDATSWNEWTLRQTWYCEQFAYLLSRLASIPEGDVTLLDHTVILWVNELAKGNTHSHQRMPFLLAGSAGGYFRTGRYLTYQNASHNDLLVSLQNAFGIEEQSFGAPEYCTGALAGLT
ncbi:MAG: DUF1552 domain-containing protein [Nannocystaceae bacterium]|nr:DUF1552 domain-containing protein [Nannocystaceae bacterium]